MTHFDRRRDYAVAQLTESVVARDPMTQFSAWVDAAEKDERIDEPHAMTLATVGRDQRPSARIVLLRMIKDESLYFFTNYESAKGRDLAANPSVALVFHWAPLERQVRVEGEAVRATGDESDAYFASRPFMSRLAAVASPQSEIISGREELEQRMQTLLVEHPEGTAVSRPEHWGGYRVVPHSFEFWQGGRSRLHDRIRYRQQDEGWTIERLAP